MAQSSETAKQVVAGMTQPPVPVTPAATVAIIVAATVKDLVPFRYGTLSSLGFANRLETRLRQWSRSPEPAKPEPKPAVTVATVVAVKRAMALKYRERLRAGSDVDAYKLGKEDALKTALQVLDRWADRAGEYYRYPANEIREAIQKEKP